MTSETRKHVSASKKDEALRPMLTISEASRVLNVHANTLRRWSARGLITEYRIGPGGHRRFKSEDIAGLILEQPRHRQTGTSKLSRY